MFNQHWFADEWRNQGHKVITIGNCNSFNINLNGHFAHIDGILSLLPDDFSPDWLVFHDNSCPLSIVGLEGCQIPLAFYSVDTHHHCLLHSYLADVFDVVFVAQLDYIRYLEGRQAVISWLPLWASKEIDPCHEKKHDVIFVGTLNRDLNPDRVVFFEELQKITSIELIEGDYALYFPYSRIVINQTVRGDLNFRVFETMRCGPLLFTERSGNGLERLFIAGEDFIPYTKGDYREVAQLLSELQINKQLITSIADNGHNKVLKYHRAHHRAKDFIEVLQTFKRSGRDKLLAGLMMNYSVFGATLGSSGGAYGVASFTHALRILSIILERREHLNEEGAFFAIVACLGFDRLTGRSSGRQMLQLLADSYPHLRTIGVGQLTLLANGGEREVVERVARIIGLPNTDIICNLFAME